MASCLMFGGLSALTMAVVIGSYASTLLYTYTPLYTPVTCVQANKTFAPPDVQLGVRIRVDAEAVVECTNPNPYSLQIDAAKPGRVLLWPQLIEIGLVYMEPYEIPAFGAALAPSYINMSIPWDAAMELYGQDHTEVLLESDVFATVSVGRALPVEIRQTFRTVQNCGFQMKVGVPLVDGNVVCAASREEVLASIPAIEPNATAVPFSIVMSDGPLVQGKQILFGTLGSVIGLSSATIIIIGCCLACRLRALHDSPKVTEAMDAEGGGTPEPETGKTDVSREHSGREGADGKKMALETSSRSLGSTDCCSDGNSRAITVTSGASSFQVVSTATSSRGAYWQEQELSRV